jgi:Mg2+-importing ATPase
MLHAPAALGGLHGESIDDLLARLQTSRQGLSADEASRRLKTFGANQIQIARLQSELAELIRASAHPLVSILLIAGAASAVLGEVTEAAIIGAIVVMSAGINVWQTFRSQRAISRLRGQIAATATVRRDGTWVELPRRDLVVGDIIQLGAVIWSPPTRVSLPPTTSTHSRPR